MRFGRLMALALVVPGLIAAAPGGSALHLGDKGYLTTQGLDVFVFTDIYPDGHQTGVTIIQHGVRVAANGDLRLEPAPGQWSPMPVAVGQRTTDKATGTISQTLSYPDPGKNGKGFNPIFYPDLNLKYSVHVAPAGGNSFRITVDLEAPLPPEWVGKVGFNLELFPTHLFGKSWLMDGQTGIFPRQANGPLVRLEGGKVPDPRNMQPNGPVQSLNGQVLGAPLATGKTLIVAPEEEKQRIQIQSRTGEMELIDGRLAHNNGWYIVRSNIAAGATKGAIEWIVTPNVVPDWRYDPVIQVSQVGYAPAQPKRAVIELDAGTAKLETATLYRLGDKGRIKALSAPVKPWGNFLRYRYATFDFSAVRDPGMYVIGYAGKFSHPFRIDRNVYARDVWQPTLEYFLPVQMCHMEVREKYRIWHGLDHQDDALMAPVSLNHFDGYAQGSSTLTKFKPGEIVPGLNAGGWHDAGDYDLRVESQMGTVWLLSRMIEEFGLDLDSTTIDQQRKLVEIHDPDGKNDAIQQIEHGLLSVLGGYRAMGRLYRGIIEPSLRQYVMLGDAIAQTDNQFRKPVADLGVDANGDAVLWDDRWVFTEDNPDRELY
ncbi:MAG: cellulase N-terminal Ig-like domain-containing protein, partial [Sphingomonas sp.]